MARETESIEYKLTKAISHKELYKNALDNICILLDRRTSELSLIKRIIDSLNYISDLNRVCEHIVDCIIDGTNAENCSLMLLDKEKNKLSIICAKGYYDLVDTNGLHSKTRISIPGKESRGGVTPPLHGEGIAGIVVKTKKPILVKDAKNDERLQELEAGTKEIGSLISAPLIIDDDVIGVFNISHPDSNNFSEKDMVIISIISNQAALSIFSAQMYSQLIQFNTELLKQVTEKENDIKIVTNHLKEAQRRLIQTKKLNALGEMASGVAHDFNNILGVILGNIKLLQRNIDIREKVQKYLEIIEKAAMDGAETVKRIQDYSRVRVSLEEFKNVDLSEILFDVISFCEAKWTTLTQKKGIVFNIDTSGIEKDIVIKANLSEIREAFVNIVNNAIDAMEKGGKLTIASTKLNGNVLVSISDNGIGMTEDVLEKIFDPFFTTKGSAGNGLGMSVTYGIIKRHQGEIFIDSKPNRGTTVSVRLPIYFNSEGKSEESVKQDVVKTEKKGSVLVVEDEIAIGEMIKEFLTFEGHSVSIANDGEEALDMIYKLNFDLIICDLGLPKKSGLEVAKEMKENPKKGKQPKFILITGWGSDFHPENLEEFGIDVFLQKPIRFDALIDFINNCLGK